MANVIEALGVSTVCISTIPPLTLNTGAPRVVGVSHPMGQTMGLPGDSAGQRAVLQQTLAAAAAMNVPRSYVELPSEWPQRRSEAVREPDPPPPIAALIAKHPWLLRRLISGELP